LIADGIDDALQLEAIKLGVGLLFKEGGAIDVQSIMNNHLMMSESSLFFKQVRITLQKLQEWHTWNEIIILKEGEEPSPPDSILILRFLQLMCEGHYLPNQDIMREQPNNPVSYNLLDDFVSYLNCLSRLPCRTSTVASIRIAATTLEVIQGPCSGNQAHLALSTELIETLNRINRTKKPNDCLEEEEIEMKQISIDIFQGLLEGQGNNSPVFERILSVIHLDIIQMMSKGLFPIETAIKDECSEQEIILQTECVVLLQILCNYKPSLYDELGISRNVEDIVGSGTAMIEVIWRGDIHRRFFHVPKVCDFLSKVSKDNLVSQVDRSNSENKLIDFLSRSHELYLEVKHQQLLTELGISGIFSRRVQDRTAWLSFSLALIINILLLVFYYVPYHGQHIDGKGNLVDTVGLQFHVHLPPKIEETIKILCIIQIIVAFIVIVLWLVVRIPVKYQYLQSLGFNPTETIIYSATDIMTLYYVWYFVFSIMGRFFKYDFLPFLLLDIVVKDSTTLDVLNAVIFPRKQLAMGSVLIYCIVQIYAFFYFMYYRYSFTTAAGSATAATFCETLFGCYKVALGYGLREGGGAGDIFSATIGNRFYLDMSYYFIINITMLNLVGGVIITTFGELREKKLRKDLDTVGLCFICGIEKQTFDRASDEPNGFLTHIKIDHNMWNYLYFIMLLWEQDKDDDDGLELYVRRAIDNNEITWFPLNKAIRLDRAATGDEALLNGLKRGIYKSEQGITDKLDKFQTQINTILEQLNQALKHDHIPDTYNDNNGSKQSRSSLRKARIIKGEDYATVADDYISYNNDLEKKSQLGIEPLYVEYSTENKNIKIEPDDKLVCNVSYGDKLWILRCENTWEESMLPKLKLSKIKEEDEDIKFNFISDDESNMIIFTIIMDNENKVLLTIEVLINDLIIAEQTTQELLYGESDDNYYKLSIYVM